MARCSSCWCFGRSTDACRYDGATSTLKALAAPLSDVLFCPTGGIDLEKARKYLALPNVVTVGGSWVAPADAIKAGDWDKISQLAREASALRA